ncbi:MAG: DUF4132 domain-containing protein [Propionibacteriaceae bacterium]|nr:DUF4132 domain-containing protein [Propionibacteriaceae bacterium]
MPAHPYDDSAAETIAVCEQILPDLTELLGDEEPLELPPLRGLPETSAEAARQQIREIVARFAEGTGPYDSSFRPIPPPDFLSPEYLQPAGACAQFDEDLLDALIGLADGSDETPPLDRGWYTIVIDALSRCCHELNFIHLARIARVIHRGDPAGLRQALLMLTRFRVGHEEVNSEPRILADALRRAGIAEETIRAQVDYQITWAYDPADLWPWFVEHPEDIESWLTGRHPDKALRVLAHYPRIPARLLPLLAERATCDSPVQRRLARQILAGTPVAPHLAGAQLGLRTPDRRILAAQWLGSVGGPHAVSTLREGLRGERNQVVRAAEIKALRACGEDIGEFLSPRTLTAEATRGLGRRWPKNLDWLDPDALPRARWADGTPVKPGVLAWWVVLADKMKDPDGSTLMALHLDQLDRGDAAELGRHIINRWIEYDTRRRSAEENRTRAEQRARWDHKEWQRRAAALTPADTDPYAQTIREQAARPLRSFINQYFENNQRSYIGSAINDKGLLALTAAMPNGELAEIVRTYMDEHPQRRAQFIALLSALAANDQPDSTELLMAIARHHSMATVQKAAGELAGRFAERHGWTADELADRTIATAGFADDGLLHLDLGAHRFHGRLTDKGRLQLIGPDSRAIRSLPGPAEGDDPDLAAAAKDRLRASRRELAAVMSRQPARLHGAMCLGRVWQSADWQESLAAHPLMRLLIARLVWLENPGTPQQRAFRPTADGAPVGVDGAPLALDPQARLAVAHGTLLGAEAAEAWRAHLSEHAVTPLFDQWSALGTPVVEPLITRMEDLSGHVSDTFRFRDTITARGYTRRDLDFHWFNEYEKAIGDSGLTVVIRFTGQDLNDEEPMPCATESLSVLADGHRLELAGLPPVLLAEARADYEAVAALGPYDDGYRRLR